jgi:acetylglutamate kinase
VVDEVLHNTVNPRVVNAIGKFGGKATGVSGKTVLGAEKMVGSDDLGFVGEVVSVDVAPIRELLDAGEVPVVTPLGFGEDGHTYNINADVSACRIAEELQARKLVFMSDVPGVLSDPTDEDTLISTIRVSDVDRLTGDGTIGGGMLPKVTSAVSAIQAGCNKVHMIDARLQHSILLEIFTDQGVGTQIMN